MARADFKSPTPATVAGGAALIPTTFPAIASAGGGGGAAATAALLAAGGSSGSSGGSGGSATYGAVSASAIEKKQRDAAVRAAVMERLTETGEKDRLMELLRTRLIECGWREDLKAYAKDVIKGKGLQKLTVDQLVADVTPRARATVPDGVKAELIQNLKVFLQQIG